MVADDLQPHDVNTGVTPHIDSIGSEGLRFANAHTPGPLCTPSRFSILTGRHPSCHFTDSSSSQLVQQIGIDGLMANSTDLQPIEFNINLPTREREGEDGARSSDGGIDEAIAAQQCKSQTIATMLRERGYVTGIVGKVCARSNRPRGVCLAR